MERIIADIGDPKSGKTLIAIGGIHGNEPSGINALKSITAFIIENNIELNGRLLALNGNLNAIKNKDRFIDEDLNRVWTDDNIECIVNNVKPDNANSEFNEMVQLYGIINDCIRLSSERIILTDLHTTSGPTIPFIVTNRGKYSLHFANSFPMPNISGIEGYLDGTLLSYINRMNHIGLAFEGGQHVNAMSQKRQESFMWLALYETGLIPSKYDRHYSKHYDFLTEELTTRHTAFSISYRFEIKEQGSFIMIPGYSNFQKVSKGEILAHYKGDDVLCPIDGFIFLPLYQKQGKDGFFIISPS